MTSIAKGELVKVFITRNLNPVSSSHEKGFAFQFYFKWFFRFCNLTCLRPMESPQSKIPYNLIQKFQNGVCAFLHLTWLCHCVLGEMDLILKPLTKNPSSIFYMALGTSALALNSCFLFSMWSQRKAMSEFINTVPSYTPKVKEWLPLALVVSYPLVAGCIDVTFKSLELLGQSYSNFWPFLAHHLEDWYYPRPLNGTNSSDATTEEQTTDQGLRGAEKFLALLGFLMADFNLLITQSSHVLTCLTSLAISEIISQRLHLLKQIKSFSNRVYIDLYLDTESLVNKINDLLGSVTLGMYCYMLCVLPVFFIDIGSSAGDQVLLRVRLLLSFLYPVVVMITASNAYNEGCKVRELVVSKTVKLLELTFSVDVTKGQGLCDTFLAYLDVTEGSLGVRAGDFFTYSFGFLGNSLCFCMTYIIVLIQLRRMPVP